MMVKQESLRMLRVAYCPRTLPLAWWDSVSYPNVYSRWQKTKDAKD